MTVWPERDILLLVAHPDLARSQVTRQLLAALQAHPVAARVEVRDLYRLYPDFHLDVAAEQAALERARIVVLLHPIYWYSMPPLQKLWLDEVLRLGWAYGPGGTALHGKDFWLCTSTGGSSGAYTPGGHNHHSLADYLLPYRQTALTCGMHYLAPQVLHAAHRASEAEIAAHAADWLQRLECYPDWCEAEAEPADGGEAQVELDERPALFSDLRGGR
jgi:glutathione-regulated potassium-efflux system ancillary protein KefF